MQIAEPSSLTPDAFSQEQNYLFKEGRGFRWYISGLGSEEQEVKKAQMYYLALVHVLSRLACRGEEEAKVPYSSMSNEEFDDILDGRDNPIKESIDDNALANFFLRMRESHKRGRLSFYTLLINHSFFQKF